MQDFDFFINFVKTSKMKSIIKSFIILVNICVVFSCNQTNSYNMKKNYDANKNEIIKLVNFIDSNVDKNVKLRIRFNNENNIDLFVYNQDFEFSKWNIDLNDLKNKNKSIKTYDSSLYVILKELNWNLNTINIIYSKLKRVNCIGISNSNPFQIEYGYNGMGTLFYLIYDYNLNKKEQRLNSDNCSKIFYKENVVLNYSNGAFGNMCHSDFIQK